ncbi:MAG: hypothetical protein GAK37_02898 [Pseudomonas sp.]|nr:MAG: hypothetical protein GAK37_02898 [Pseudomonas sp.]
MHADFTVGHHHALGLAGGAGGVNQVGLVLRRADKRRFGVRVVGEHRLVFFQTPARHASGQFTEGIEHCRIAEQQADAAVFDHVVQAVQRVFRVERHIGAARLEDRQQAHHHLQRAWQGQADPHLRAHTAFAQHPGQAVGAAVQFTVAQGVPGKRQRRGVRTGLRLLAEQRVQALVEAMLARLGPQGRVQGVLLIGLQQRQFAQALLRVFDQRLQQVAPMPGHACNARFVKQVGAVGEAATQAMVEVGDLQVQVELGGACIVGQVLHGHAGQLAALLELPALHVAHHLEQRVVRRAARRLQRLDQVVERQVLMGLAFDDGVAHLFEQLAHAHLPVELATQHLGVEERADQPFAFRANAVGHRGADAQVGLATVAVEQHGQGGSHGHEQGQAAFGIEGTHAGGQLVAQVKAVQLAPVALHGRARAIAGQFQQRVFIAQLRGPVIQLALALAGFKPLALPHAVVQVLHRQRRQRRLALVDKGFIERAEFTGKNVHGPAFGDDVVQGEHQVMFLLAGLDQAGAQQRAGFQIERRVGLMVGQLLQALLALGFVQRREVLPRHAYTGLRGDLLLRHAVHAREGGAQGFMAHDERLQCRLKPPDIQHTAQARHAAHVVGRTVRFHLPQEPHALLRIRQRHRAAAVHLGDCRLLVALARGLDNAHLLGKRAQFAGLKQRAQRQLHVAGLTGARDDLRGQQRVAAKGKKVIAQADARQAEHFAPDRGDLLLQRRLGLHMFTHLPHRFRQGAAVEFAAGAQRHGVQAHQLRGHHVLRQLGGQSGFDAVLIQFDVGGVVANQLCTGGGFTYQHHSIGDAVQRQQAGFDFFRLHTETAQFYLLIQTAEVFQHTVCTPTHTVAGAVQTRARSIRHEAFGGEPRTPEIPTGQADAADAQLAGYTDRHRVEVFVQYLAHHVAQRAANGRALAVFGVAVPMGHVDRGFGGAVTVV